MIRLSLITAERKNLPVPTKPRTNKELGMMNPRLNRVADLTPAFHHEYEARWDGEFY